MKTISTEQFIEKAKQVHNNKYDYSLVDYYKCKSKIKIICPEHGVFEQTPKDHISSKNGCPKCKFNKLRKDRQHSFETFISLANDIHNYRYDYSLINYINSHTKIKIICKIHGVFEQIPNSHLKGRGCPKCNLSKGELKIENWFKEHNIKYETQKRFNDCRNKRPLPFDFYLPEYNTCIEFDGIHHFKPYSYSTIQTDDYKEKMYNITKLKDNIKTQYCYNNNINLIRITNYNQIDTILLNFIQMKPAILV